MAAILRKFDVRIRRLQTLPAIGLSIICSGLVKDMHPKRAHFKGSLTYGN